MSTDQESTGGEVINFPRNDPGHAGPDAARSAQSPGHGTGQQITEKTAPVAAHSAGDDEALRRPIVPPQWRQDARRGTLAQFGGLWWYKARYHGLRCPMYTVLTLWYALRGVARLRRRLWAWWQWTDGWVLESQAVAAGRLGHHDALNAHREGKKTRAVRGQIVAFWTLAALVAVFVAVRWLPVWGWAILTAVAVRMLAPHGAPEGQPIIRAAVVPTAYQTPTPEVITRGFGSLGIGAINAVIKDGLGLSFVSDVHRDGDGWGVELDLPHGVTARDIVKKREALASGLRRPHSATWPEPVPHEHAGRLYLWIGRRDLSKTKPVPYPLLRSGQADVFACVPFATSPRGQLVTAPLFEANTIVGAAPGQGKTATLRVLACGAALDPIADLWIHEHSGKGDLDPLAQVCHRYVSGQDDEALAYSAESLRKLRAELDRREGVFKKLTRDERPDGNLTRDLAARRSLRLRPIVVIFDEVQNLFLSPYGGKAAEDMAHVMRLGRAYGIIIILATQRPDSDCIPTKIAGLVTVRFCLKVPDQPANDMVLGTGSYKAGYRASEFRHGIDAGLGWFKGQGDPQAVRTHYLNLKDTERVAARARAMRQAAGVLSGYALGETSTDEVRDFAGDVLSVFGQARNLHTATIAARLREHLPGVYGDITRDAVASQLRALGVPVKDVREAGGTNRKGCERAAVETVTDSRETADV